MHEAAEGARRATELIDLQSHVQSRMPDTGRLNHRELHEVTYSITMRLTLRSAGMAPPDPSMTRRGPRWKRRTRSCRMRLDRRPLSLAALDAAVLAQGRPTALQAVVQPGRVRNLLDMIGKVLSSAMDDPAKLGQSLSDPAAKSAIKEELRLRGRRHDRLRRPVPASCRTRMRLPPATHRRSRGRPRRQPAPWSTRRPERPNRNGDR